MTPREKASIAMTSLRSQIEAFEALLRELDQAQTEKTIVKRDLDLISHEKSVLARRVSELEGSLAEVTKERDVLQRGSARVISLVVGLGPAGAMEHQFVEFLTELTAIRDRAVNGGNPNASLKEISSLISRCLRAK